MAHVLDAPESSPVRRSRWLIVSLFPAGLLILLIIVFLNVGRWLVVEDPLAKAQAIVVLSGRMPLRAIEAARLYNAGYAPQVWLTRPREPAASLELMHIAYLGEDFFNSRVLLHEGVSPDSILVVEPSIENTADELRVVAAELVRQNGSGVIIVTTKAHTRRVRTLWREVTGGRRHAIIRAAANDPFQPGRWWGTTGDALDVLREVLGLLNAWAGLPLRPST